MPRPVSRTPHVTRLRQSATPVRVPRMLMMPPSMPELETDFASPAGTVSQITEPERTPSTALDVLTPALPGGDTCCALCQLPVVEGCTSPPSDALWTWPGHCGVQLHVACAVQIRLRSEKGRPAFIVVLRGPARLPMMLCHQRAVMLDFPYKTRGNHSRSMMKKPDVCAGMPSAPERVLVLCCARLSAFDAP